MPAYNLFEKSGFNGVIAAFSRRSDGNMSLNLGDTRDSLESRRKFLTPLGIEYRNLITAKQVHGRTVRRVGALDRCQGALDQAQAVEDTDGFITDEPGVPLGILTADCLSVFILDPARPAVGCLHAGWRSTEKNIAAEGIRLMRENFGSDPRKLFAAFGPAIRGCCLEMEKDFKSNFPFGLFQKEGRLFMDIALINKRQLLESGLKEENISDPQLCTYCGGDFFSFRKEAQGSGRMLSVIMLK